MNPKTQKWKMDHQTTSTSENIQPPHPPQKKKIQIYKWDQSQIKNNSNLEFLKWVIKKTETIPPQIQTQSLNVMVSYSYPQSFSQ